MKIEEVSKLLDDDLQGVNSLADVNELKVKYLGKKGLITELNSEIKNVPNEEKREFGQRINALRDKFNSFYEEKKNFFETAALNEKLVSEAIDISLPALKITNGAPNILEKLVEEVEEVCMSMGYDVVD